MVPAPKTTHFMPASSGLWESCSCFVEFPTPEVLKAYSQGQRADNDWKMSEMAGSIRELLGS